MRIQKHTHVVWITIGKFYKKIHLLVFDGDSTHRNAEYVNYGITCMDAYVEINLPDVPLQPPFPHPKSCVMHHLRRNEAVRKILDCTDAEVPTLEPSCANAA